jgi:hypothetical protein
VYDYFIPMHHSRESPIYNIRTVLGAIGVQDSHNNSGGKNVLLFGFYLCCLKRPPTMG